MQSKQNLCVHPDSVARSESVAGRSRQMGQVKSFKGVASLVFSPAFACADSDSTPGVVVVVVVVVVRARFLRRS